MNIFLQSPERLAAAEKKPRGKADQIQYITEPDLGPVEPFYRSYPEPESKVHLLSQTPD